MTRPFFCIDDTQPCRRQCEACATANGLPEGRRSTPAGALEVGSPIEAARDSNPRCAGLGGVYSEAEIYRKALVKIASMDMPWDSLEAAKAIALSTMNDYDQRVDHD